jgi:hypothetical protein
VVKRTVLHHQHNNVLQLVESRRHSMLQDRVMALLGSVIRENNVATSGFV